MREKEGEGRGGRRKGREKGGREGKEGEGRELETERGLGRKWVRRRKECFVRSQGKMGESRRGV